MRGRTFEEAVELSINERLQLLTSTTGLLQVCLHTVVVREHRGGGSNFSTHITDGGHS